MKNNKLIIIVSAVVVSAILIVFFAQKSNVAIPQNTPIENTVTGSEKNTFSGAITAFDTGCFVDAVCSVTVDEKKIILVAGGLALDADAAVGKLVGVPSIGDLEGKIGARANVYAGFITEGVYTLYGNSEYYVEVLQ